MLWESAFSDVGIMTRFSQMTLVGLFSVLLSSVSTHGAGFSPGPYVSPSVCLSVCLSVGRPVGPKSVLW